MEMVTRLAVRSEGTPQHRSAPDEGRWGSRVGAAAPHGTARSTTDPLPSGRVTLHLARHHLHNTLQHRPHRDLGPRSSPCRSAPRCSALESLISPLRSSSIQSGAQFCTAPSAGRHDRFRRSSLIGVESLHNSACQHPARSTSLPQSKRRHQMLPLSQSESS